MISQELMDEVIYVSLMNKYINKDLIKKIVIDVISNCDRVTQNEFSGIYFKATSWEFTVAEVDEKGRVFANYQKLIEQAAEFKFASYLEKNLKILGCLLHEIEHLKEESKKRKKDNTAMILKYGCSEYIYDSINNRISKKKKHPQKASGLVNKQFVKFNEKYWEYMPSERIAETSSRKILVESFKKYPDSELNFFSEYKSLVNYYVDSLKMGYVKRDFSFQNAPIVQYFEALRKEKTLNYILENITDVNSEEKMIYGFPIEPKDVVEINKLKIRTRR